jgi:hypothetical protein
MSDSNLSQTTPQFSTAEYTESSNGYCVACKQAITARYYSVNNKVVCESCAQQLERRFPKDSHAAYMGALLFGVGAAIIGMILYAAFTIVTHIYLGYVSLAVGWLVGKAIMLGSKGIGGRRYQITSAILTYAAVSIAAIPIAISGHMISKPSSGADLLQLLMIGLASPFLGLQDPLHGIIGLIILGVGIRIAWRMTAGLGRVNIQGPYDKSMSASV